MRWPRDAARTLTRRVMPERFGPRKGIWTGVSLRPRAGAFAPSRAMPDGGNGAAGAGTMSGSTGLRAPLSAARAKGRQGKRPRALKGRFCGRVHLKTAFLGRPLTVEVDGGGEVDAPIMRAPGGVARDP